MTVRDVLADKGLELPPLVPPPAGFSIPFELVRLRGDRAYVSGHLPQEADGSLTGPFGKVPSAVPLEDARQAARLAGLSMLANIERALGSLDRVSAWLVVSGFVNADIGFGQTTLVINAFSDLILDVFGPDIGAHARTAIGVVSLPMDACVVIAAELLVSSA